MRRIAKSLLCMLLAAVLLVSLAACGGGDGDGGEGSKPTYLTRAKELAETIDKVPSMSALCELGGGAAGASVLASSASATLQPLACPDGYTDVTDPKDNADYQAAIADGRHRHMDMYAAGLSNSDLSVRNVQEIKKDALNEIIQLNTWVKTQGGALSNKYRMSYDPFSDVVTIEMIEDYDYLGKYAIQYRHITATYNEKGESVISAYFLETLDGEMYMTESIHFEENNFFAISYDSNGNEDIVGDEEEYDFFCYADLASAGKDTVCMYKNRYITFSRIGENRAYVLMEGENQSQIRIENAAGERLGYLNVSRWGTDINMDIYELGGITGIYKNGNDYKLEVNGEPLKSGSFFDNCWSLVQVSATPIEDYIPLLRVSVSFSAQATLSAKEILDGTLADLGITIADPSALRQYAMAGDLNAFYNSYRVFKDVGVENADTAWIVSMMEKYALPAVSNETLTALLTEPAIEKQAQVADENYYAVFRAQFTGTASLNAETLQIDLGGINGSTELSAMLTVGEEYALVAALWDGTLTPVGEAVATCTETGLSVTGLGVIDVTELAPGQYKIRVFLAKKTADGYTRISNFLAPTTEEPITASVTVDGTVYTVTADATAMTVTVEPVPQTGEAVEGQNAEKEL